MFVCDRVCVNKTCIYLHVDVHVHVPLYMFKFLYLFVYVNVNVYLDLSLSLKRLHVCRQKTPACSKHVGVLLAHTETF